MVLYIMKKKTDKMFGIIIPKVNIYIILKAREDEKNGAYI